MHIMSVFQTMYLLTMSFAIIMSLLYLTYVICELFNENEAEDSEAEDSGATPKGRGK